MGNAPECQDEIIRKEDEIRHLAFSCLKGKAFMSLNIGWKAWHWKETFHKTKAL